MEATIEKVKQFIGGGLLVSPWLAGVGDKSRIDDEIFHYLDQEARSIAEKEWTTAQQDATFGPGFPRMDRIARTAIYETAASTTVWIAHEESGSDQTTMAYAKLAMQRLLTYKTQYGIGTLVEVYAIATRYENYQALHYYKEMPERVFIQGTLHRPWIEYSLQDEVSLGLLAGNLTIIRKHDQRFIALSPKGELFFAWLQNVLGQAGYLKNRIHHLHISRFNSAIIFEQTIAKFVPGWIEHRQQFVDWLDLMPGMKVLEIGSGDGLLTIEGGLAERIGSQGSLVCLDPSKGMLARLARKVETNALSQVKILQGRAENIPFADHTFDAVIASSVLHLTDTEAALKEIHRVVKPGGFVGAFNLLPFGMDEPFFIELMKPIMDLAKDNQQQSPRTFLIDQKANLEAFAKTGWRVEKSQEIDERTLYWWPREIVDVLIRGLGWAQEELATLPWAAREELITLLQDRGEMICRKYPQEDRILVSPMIMIKATKV